MRGALSAALVLVAIQAALSSEEATTRVGKLVQHVADLSRRFLDPSIPAIPDLSAGDSAPPGAGGQAGRPQRQQAGGGDQDDDDGRDWWNPFDWSIPPGML